MYQTRDAPCSSVEGAHGTLKFVRSILIEGETGGLVPSLTSCRAPRLSPSCNQRPNVVVALERG